MKHTTNEPPSSKPGQSSALPLGEVYTTTTTAPIPYPNGTRYERLAANPAFAPSWRRSPCSWRSGSP